MEFIFLVGSNIGIMFMNGQGAPVSLQVVGTQVADLNPDIVYNPGSFLNEENELIGSSSYQ